MTKLKSRHAWTVKVGERGQIVIPKEARDIFNIKPGDTLIMLGDKQQGIAIPTKNKVIDTITAVLNDTEIKS